MLSSRSQQRPDVLRRRLVVQVFRRIPQRVQQGLRLRGRLLLQELDAALHVHGRGTAEGTGRVDPVVQDDEPHHHAQH